MLQHLSQLCLNDIGDLISIGGFPDRKDAMLVRVIQPREEISLFEQMLYYETFRVFKPIKVVRYVFAKPSGGFIIVPDGGTHRYRFCSK